MSDRPLLASGYRPAQKPHVVSFAPRSDPAPLRLRSGQVGLALRVALRYEIVEAMPSSPPSWAVLPLGYSYDILDRDGREIVVYHWHPFGIGPSFPHLHVSGRVGDLSLGAGLPSVAIGSAHLPTGYVELAAVIQLLIAEFEVSPRLGDWRRV
ncbi:MAG: hypothetical protein H0U10_00505, partial [Chloroflexia bacterium]|nr:hypothetical protein [Chloroflexia bacterium]